MTSKDVYRKLCSTEKTIPLFSRDWWLDAVCGKDRWDVVIEEKGDQVFASLPFFITVKYGFRMIKMPALTQHMGVWIKYPENQKYAKMLSYQRDITARLVDRLPQVASFHQRFHYSFTNWLPFFWRGYSQSSRYTYILEDLTDLDEIFSQFKTNIKTDVRKAGRILTVTTDDDFQKIVDLNRLTFSRQQTDFELDERALENIESACREKKCRKMFFAKDAEDRVHAALYLVWDETSAYYLLGARDSSLENTGATSLLLWEAIQHASTVTTRFDFEGSMLKPVERFFSAFGAVQKPYFDIKKTNSALLRLVNLIR